MVDNATLKNPKGFMSSNETQAELGNEKRTWTIRDTPEAGTYTLQAIVDAREKEKAESQEINVDPSSITTKMPTSGGTTDLSSTEDQVDQSIDLTEVEEEEEAENQEFEELQNANVAQRKLKNQSIAKQNEAEKAGLDTGWFFITVIIAVILDILAFVISFLPFVGEAISSIIIMPIGMMFIWVMHVFGGAKLDTKAKVKLTATGIIEVIPILNMLPALTVCVLLSKAEPLIEQKLNKALENNKILEQIPGGKEVGGKVLKSNIIDVVSK